MLLDFTSKIHDVNTSGEDKDILTKYQVNKTRLEFLISSFKSKIDIDYNKLRKDFINIFNTNIEASPMEEEITKLKLGISTYYYNRHTRDYSFSLSHYVSGEDYSELREEVGLEYYKTISYLEYLVEHLIKIETWQKIITMDVYSNKTVRDKMDAIIFANRAIDREPGYRYGLIYKASDSLTMLDEAKFSPEVIDINNKRCIPTIRVTDKWVTDVHDRKFTVLEYEGSSAYMLKANYLETDGDHDIYDAQLLQIKGTRDEVANASWYSATWSRISPLFKVKDVVLAVDDTMESRIYAIGKDKSWAQRTLRRRQKARMMSSLVL